MVKKQESTIVPDELIRDEQKEKDLKNGEPQAEPVPEAAGEGQEESSLSEPVTDTALANAFGGSDEAPPIEVGWPEIKMGKDKHFTMPDGSLTTDLWGHIVFAQKTRAWWSEPYGSGGDAFPDCASSNGKWPDVGENIQLPESTQDGVKSLCEVHCNKSRWVKYPETGKRSTECNVSTVLIILLLDQEIPFVLRVRSTSCGKKSSLAKFFSSCIMKKAHYQTCEVYLRLVPTKIGGFDTSRLEVGLGKSLENNDPKLRKLIEMYNQVKSDFVMTYQQPDFVEEGSVEDCPI